MLPYRHQLADRYHQLQQKVVHQRGVVHYGSELGMALAQDHVAEVIRRNVFRYTEIKSFFSINSVNHL